MVQSNLKIYRVFQLILKINRVVYSDLKNILGGSIGFENILGGTVDLNIYGVWGVDMHRRLTQNQNWGVTE